MFPTTIDGGEKIFFNCVSIIETPECNDGTSEICDMILINEIDTILDIFSLDNENIKAIYIS